MFHPILEQALQEQKLQRIVISTDDTRVWRNGQHVPQTQWHRDPLGPPFQTNLRSGHLFLQASLVLKLPADPKPKHTLLKKSPLFGRISAPAVLP